MKRTALCTATVIAMGAAFAAPYPPTVMQFEGVVPAHSVLPVQYYFEDGYNLTVHGPNHDTAAIWGADTGATNTNHTTIYSWFSYPPSGYQPVVQLSHWGALFDFDAVDVNNLWSEAFNGPIPTDLEIIVTGHKWSGGTVTQSLPILPDTWKSYALAGFTDLTSVTFSAWSSDGSSTWPGGLALDNLELAYAPEPDSLALVLGGWFLFAFIRRRKPNLTMKTAA